MADLYQRFINIENPGTMYIELLHKRGFHHIVMRVPVGCISVSSMLLQSAYCQSYEIKSPPWTILWFRILGIFSVENIARLGAFMHCKVIIGRNPIEANANTIAIQLPGNPLAYIGKCFTPY